MRGSQPSQAQAKGTCFSWSRDHISGVDMWMWPTPPSSPFQSRRVAPEPHGRSLLGPEDSPLCPASVFGSTGYCLSGAFGFGILGPISLVRGRQHWVKSRTSDGIATRGAGMSPSAKATARSWPDSSPRCPSCRVLSFSAETTQLQRGRGGPGHQMFGTCVP